MAGSSSRQDIFDVEKLRQLVELMEAHELNEIDLRQGDTKVQLRRGIQPVVASPVGGPASASAASPSAPAAETKDAEEEHIAVIKSPMVGTYYSAPDPGSPAFVKVGDHVGPDTTVCIIEAMKVFNQIPAEVSGKIVSVLAENGEPVEFGQPMFKVDTRG
ncbi:MAG TPA: acetyl-CoA carboxylase biotin carboxyl carrier protein [Thermoguttaceae bacterium]|nr:acetyl-CoA carboxylase biotin carboxyl carrier protein [Thermoguttaceae bacterium]